MPQYIEVGADVIEFPDGMSDAEITAVLSKQTPAPTAPAAAPVAPKVDANGIPLEHDYKVPAKQAPLVSKETMGSIAGTVVGGGLGVLAAPLTGPFGAVAGGTIGSALGAAAGAYLDATDKGDDPNAAMNAALNAAGVDLAWSIGGGVVLKFAGKTAKFAAGSEVGQWVAKHLGFGKSVAAPQVAKHAEKALVGDTIFANTSPAEAARLAREAATGLQTEAQRAGRAGLTPSQITGNASWAERQARAQEGDLFKSVQESNEKFIQENIVTLRDRIARTDMSGSLAREATGKKLQGAIDATETAIKDKHRATFEILSNPKGPLAGAGSVDVRDALKLVDDELLKTANPEKIATLNELKKLLGDGAPINLTRANEFLKEWGAEAASLARLGKADSPVQALYARMATDMRTKFNAALDVAAASGKITPELRQAIDAAKADYKVMHQTLYSPTGSKLSRVAQTTPEDVLNVIAQKGATSEIGELKQIVALAQSTGNNAAAVDARAALRELQAAYFQRELPDSKALAKLSQRLKDDKPFADQFNLLIPDSKGVRLSVERLAQAAKMVERNAGSGAANTGLITGVGMTVGSGVGTGLGMLAGNPVAAAVLGMVGVGAGAAAVNIGRKVMAHSLTKPSLRDAMPAVTAYAVAIAAGKKVGIPQAVQAWYDELKADGFITDAPAAAPAPANEAPINDQVDPNAREVTTSEYNGPSTAGYQVPSDVQAGRDVVRNQIIDAERATPAYAAARNMPRPPLPHTVPVSWGTGDPIGALRAELATTKNESDKAAIRAEITRLSRLQR
jgi:hypothetical protein